MVAQLTKEQLIEMLHDDNPKVRIRALRRLAAIGQIEAVTDIVNIYKDIEQPPAVRKAAAKSLGVFKAIKVAVDNEQPVDLPDPSDVSEPRFSPEFLGRLTLVLGVVLVVLLIINGLVVVIKRTPAPVSGVIPADTPLMELVILLQARAEQARIDVDQQQQSWREYAGVGVFVCEKYASASLSSLSVTDLEALPFTEADQPQLYAANNTLIQAINAFIIPNGNWVIGCSTGTAPVTADDALAQLASISLLLEEASAGFAEAANALGVPPTAGETDVTAGATEALTPATSAAPTETAVPSITPTPFPYRPYITGMRATIDSVINGRGVTTLLQQYWVDVVNSGQSFGCRQPLSGDAIQEYQLITADIAAVDPRLLAIQERINLGLQMTRDSLTLFQQGCASGVFTDPVNNGQTQINQAVTLLQEASSLLDALQAETSTP